MSFVVECTSAAAGALHFVFGAKKVLVYLFGSSKSPRNILSGYFELGVQQCTAQKGQPGRRGSQRSWQGGRGKGGTRRSSAGGWLDVVGDSSCIFQGRNPSAIYKTLLVSRLVGERLGEVLGCAQGYNAESRRAFESQASVHSFPDSILFFIRPLHFL